MAQVLCPTLTPPKAGLSPCTLQDTWLFVEPAGKALLVDEDPLLEGWHIDNSTFTLPKLESFENFVTVLCSSHLVGAIEYDSLK